MSTQSESQSSFPDAVTKQKWRDVAARCTFSDCETPVMSDLESPHPIVLVNDQATIVAINGPAEVLLACESTSAINRPLRDLLGAESERNLGAGSAASESEPPEGPAPTWQAAVRGTSLHVEVMRVRFAYAGKPYWLLVLRNATAPAVVQRGIASPHSRSIMLDRISLALARRERQPKQLYALLFIDLDRFKSFNDAHGMVGGDQILSEVARRIRVAVRKIDAVAQFSHLDRDEFAVLLEELRAVEDARRIAQRVLDVIREPIVIAGGTQVYVSASIGIAIVRDSFHDPERLIQDAETAMLRAKSTPEDPCQLLDTTMHERARERLRLESELRAALAADEFVLHYQPIVSLKSGRVTSCEALVRWNHPKRGFVPPMEFISIAEETGMISAIGAVVLEKACLQAKAWATELSLPLSVSVNVSPRQLTEGHLIETVQRALANANLSPHLLKIEITESVAARDAKGAIDTLQVLKDMGVELLMDDFGTGYSSLSRLTHFPLHKLKIDRSFVSQIDEGGQGSSVASAIVALAHSLGLQVIAEGVETRDQALFLRRIGCEEMQGYYFSKPIDRSAFEDLFRTRKQLRLDDMAVS